MSNLRDSHIRLYWETLRILNRWKNGYKRILENTDFFTFLLLFINFNNLHWFSVI